jgi:TolA-binding protein
MARIRQIRREPGAADQPEESSGTDPRQERIRALEARVAQLEQLVQGLQDSVHRESSRQTKRIAELETRTQPAALGKALSEDARARGL